MPQPDLSRRKFLINSGLITIGFSVTGGCQLNGNDSSNEKQSLPSHLSGEPMIDSWLQIFDDGRIRILTGKLELGQGIRVAVGQVAAEELNTDPDKVDVHLAETDVTPDEGYTSGSMSIETSAMAVRFAAAAAREILLNKAAEKLQASPLDLKLENGEIKTAKGDHKLSFTEAMDGHQIHEKVELPVQLKSKTNYQWVGKPVFRKEIEQMVRANRVYVHDLRFPEMVHARIIRPSGYASVLLSYDESGLKKNIDGILKVVRNGSFLGVVTFEEYQAVQAQEYLNKNSQWTKPQSLPAGKSLKEYIRNQSTKAVNVAEKGSVKLSDSSHKASYFKPYIMHGSIGPSCAIAHYDGNRLEIWSHSQGVYPLRDAISNLTGIPDNRIHITGIPGSGCYGHNGADDVAADATLLALAYPGKHIRLQWSRANEHGWEPYGSAMVMELEATLSANGRIENWKYDLWSDTHSTRPRGNAGSLLAGREKENPFKMESRGYLGGGYRNAVPYYTIKNFKIDGHYFDGPLRVSALRSLGAFANIFAIESFMDELAEIARKDPLDFRLSHLDDIRAKDVINKVKEMTSEVKVDDLEGLGYAFSRYKNEASYIAVAAKVTMVNSQPIVRQMWAAIDSGEIINPDGLRNQTEGGMIQAASWTLKEQVKFNEKQVTGLDWAGYPVLRYNEIPLVEVAVLDRPGKPPMGAGEAAQGPAGAAIINAINRASGKRIRDLPVMK